MQKENLGNIYAGGERVSALQDRIGTGLWNKAAAQVSRTVLTEGSGREEWHNRTKKEQGQYTATWQRRGELSEQTRKPSKYL